MATRNLKLNSNNKFVSDTWMCWKLGVGELESVDHGWSRDSRCLSRRQGQVSSCATKDWLNLMFAGISAGCTRVPGSSPLFFIFHMGRL